jgi:hypothetical protein
MKATFFNKPLEWNLETREESWPQGSTVNGTIRVKNHGAEKMDLRSAGVGLAYADIKKVHAKTEGALKPEVQILLDKKEVSPGETIEMNFSLTLPENCPVSDKKSSFFLTYGRNLSEKHLQLKIEPKILYGKLIGILDTFCRFKLKEFKGTKKGVEYKLLPPTSREMANLDSLNLTLSMKGESLNCEFDFQVKKLETSGVTNKINKSSVKIERSLTPKEYSLGRDMINQDQLLKVFEGVIGEVKLQSVF